MVSSFQTALGLLWTWEKGIQSLLATFEVESPSHAMKQDKPSSPSGRFSRRVESYGMTIRGAGPAVMIPGLLLGGPLVGLALGWLAEHYLGCPSWSRLVGLLIGIAAGIRETVIIIKRLETEDDEKSGRKD